jgi:serine/threonine-protein kinase
MASDESVRAGEQRAELLRLAALGAPDGPSIDEALASFARLRAGPEEARAVATLLAIEGRRPLPEPVLLAVAAALVDRGEDSTAARVLGRATSPPGLMLRAEVLARAGDRAGAIALVERVLLRDLAWPGARERHARWRAELGLPVGAERDAETLASATLAASAPEAPFRLLREVGRGGAGVVFESEDRDLGRRVALKVYHRPDRDCAQLLHEARVAVALAGPGIVRVFDVDPQHGWLAMEWARLGAVRTLLRQREPALLPIGRWAEPLARALARVHAAGWVHNDVKPANVLLREPHAPLISDLGTARRVGDPSPPGSLGYVSPERLAGRASDPLDDIYGFGRILEDAVGILEVAGDTPRWTRLASACTSTDDERQDAFAALLRQHE